MKHVELNTFLGLYKNMLYIILLFREPNVKNGHKLINYRTEFKTNEKTKWCSIHEVQ